MATAGPPPQGMPMPMVQPPQNMPQIQPGQQPTPEQIQEIQRRISEEAQKHGMSVQEYVERLKMQAMQQHQMQMRMQQMQQQQQQQQQGGQPQGQPQGQGPPQQQMQQQQQQQPQTQQIPINSGAPPKPEALAVAQFLKTQDLKPRQCQFNNQRKELFKVKRAIRALMSPAYEKARKKNALLPEVNDRVTAENTFKMLPMSLLALRVSKIDEHEGHDHAKKKTKGFWTVKVEPQQEAHDEMYYVWIFEGPQWKTKLYAAGALALILAVVFFPVWPYKLRLGVWYLSMACLGVLGLFFAMAIFRLILFVITMFAVPPGIWLYPNLFEDVGFFDSFKPLWAWQETAESKKAAKAAKKDKKRAKAARRAAGSDGDAGTGSITAPDGVGAEGVGATGSNPSDSVVRQRQPQAARIEEVEDDE